MEKIDLKKRCNKMKVCYIPYYGNELNDKAFSKQYDARWTNQLKRLLEKDGHEIHTYDILPVEEADSILCFDNVYFQNVRHFQRLLECGKLGNTTHIDYEPPSGNCRIHDDTGLRLLSNLFKSLITYNDHVVNGNTIVKGCIGDYYGEEREYKNDFKSRKLVAMVANYRAGLMLFGPHPDSLYNQRLEAVDYFMEHCANSFDLYGGYWPDKYSKISKGVIERKDKIDVISKYKFLISYDSITNQDGYISEKIFDCFKAKTVPIYWGANNITDYIPKDCFIDRRDFSSYQALEDFLKKMTEKQYKVYITAIEKYLKSDAYFNLFSSEASARIIYKELLRPQRKLNIQNVETILSEFEEKRKSDNRYNCSNNYYDNRYPTFASVYNFILLEKDGYTDYNILFQRSVDERYKDIKIFKRQQLKDSDTVPSYQEIKIDITKNENVYHAYDWNFKLTLGEIMAYDKTELFTYNEQTNTYCPLEIDLVASWEGFEKYFDLKVRDNYFYKGTLYVPKKEKMIEFLSKYHLVYVSKVLYRIIKLPYVFVKQFIEVFK